MNVGAGWWRRSRDGVAATPRRPINRAADHVTVVAPDERLIPTGPTGADDGDQDEVCISSEHVLLRTSRRRERNPAPSSSAPGPRRSIQALSPVPGASAACPTAASRARWQKKADPANRRPVPTFESLSPCVPLKGAAAATRMPRSDVEGVCRIEISRQPATGTLLFRSSAAICRRTGQRGGFFASDRVSLREPVMPQPTSAPSPGADERSAAGASFTAGRSARDHRTSSIRLPGPVWAAASRSTRLAGVRARSRRGGLAVRGARSLGRTPHLVGERGPAVASDGLPARVAAVARSHVASPSAHLDLHPPVALRDHPSRVPGSSRRGIRTVRSALAEPSAILHSAGRASASATIDSARAPPPTPRSTTTPTAR